jgi:hypothetical protein
VLIHIGVNDRLCGTLDYKQDSPVSTSTLSNGVQNQSSFSFSVEAINPMPEDDSGSSASPGNQS